MGHNLEPKWQNGRTHGIPVISMDIHGYPIKAIIEALLNAIIKVIIEAVKEVL